MGKPRRSGLRSKWHRQPSPPPPSTDGETARRNGTQQASVGVGGDPASGGATAATCGRHGEMDTIVAAHRVAASCAEAKASSAAEAETGEARRDTAAAAAKRRRAAVGWSGEPKLFYPKRAPGVPAWCRLPGGQHRLDASHVPSPESQNTSSLQQTREAETRFPSQRAVLELNQNRSRRACVLPCCTTATNKHRGPLSQYRRRCRRHRPRTLGSPVPWPAPTGGKIMASSPLALPGLRLRIYLWRSADVAVCWMAAQHYSRCLCFW
ncbi:hypothetical protein BS78_K085900 [Paspalum vaginatum]|uniref:Uncharacterized protein n=1 Tax=Paspalum vaginatum TaxID=158149 RepID=A0A9W7XDW7_9POAL|nr:hypothetical protein BS78_K085900 [Paspalum vaginatum]